MNGELGDGQSEGAGEDTEEVPDHEKVGGPSRLFVQNICAVKKIIIVIV